MNQEEVKEALSAAYEAGKLVGHIKGLKQGLAIAFVTLFAILALLIIKNF